MLNFHVACSLSSCAYLYKVKKTALYTCFKCSYIALEIFLSLLFPPFRFPPLPFLFHMVNLIVLYLVKTESLICLGLPCMGTVLLDKIWSMMQMQPLSELSDQLIYLFWIWLRKTDLLVQFCGLAHEPSPSHGKRPNRSLIHKHLCPCLVSQKRHASCWKVRLVWEDFL